MPPVNPLVQSQTGGLAVRLQIPFPEQKVPLLKHGDSVGGGSAVGGSVGGGSVGGGCGGSVGLVGGGPGGTVGGASVGASVRGLVGFFVG